MRCAALLFACASAISATEIFIESKRGGEIFIESDDHVWFTNNAEDTDVPSSEPSSGPSSGPARIVDGIDCGEHPAACGALDHVEAAFARARAQIEKLATPEPPEDVAKAIRAASRGGIREELQGILTELNRTGSHPGGEWEKRELLKRLKGLQKEEEEGLERALDDREQRDEDELEEREARVEGALDDMEFRMVAVEAVIESEQLHNGEKLLRSLKRKESDAKKSLEKVLKKAKKDAKKATKRQRKEVLKQAKKALKEEYKRFRSGDYAMPPEELAAEAPARARLVRVENVKALALLGLVGAMALVSWRRPAQRRGAAAEPLLVHLA